MTFRRTVTPGALSGSPAIIPVKSERRNSESFGTAEFENRMDGTYRPGIGILF
jgi:hypothetical protein